MGKTAKAWLIAGALLILAGCIIFGSVMLMLKWDLTKLSTTKYETNTYEISQDFSGISVKTETADILLAPSDDGKCRVVCHEQENAKHSVAVRDGTLSIHLDKQRTFRDFISRIGINLDTPEITVYLPETEYASLLIRGNTGDIDVRKVFHFADADISLSTGDVTFCASASKSVKIETTTGEIRAEDLSAGSLALSVTTGKVTSTEVRCEGPLTLHATTGKATLSDITCKSLTSTGSTGDILLTRVVAKEAISIERSTGNVRFDSSDAGEMFVKTGTGSITGSLLTDKVFIASTSTGKLDVPKTTTGGSCELHTGTGSIQITIG